jgi:glycosyltransferase involved in cell wall biosynthesis
MTKPMRALLVTTFYPPYGFGGDAIYAWRLANALAGDGHFVDVIHGADFYELLAGRRPLPASLPNHRNVTVYSLRCAAPMLVALAGHQSGFPLGRGSQIAQVIDGKQYDLIHFNNISMFGPAILGLKTFGKLPVKLFTMQEYWLICASHLLWKFGRRTCESEQCLECVVRASRPPQLWRYGGLLNRMARNVDRFLAPSRAVAQIHRNRGFSHPMDHFPLFTEVPEEKDLVALPRRLSNPYWLFAGRLEPYKGLENLIAAWGQASAMDLAIAGNGSEFERIRTQCAANPRIHVLDHVSPTALSALYRHAYACVVPSRFEEPFGLVAIEALAHRTPVIAGNFGGLREIVGESGGGFLYETIAELAGLIRRLESDPCLRDQLAEQGRRRCLELWSAPAHQRRYYSLVREIQGARNSIGAARERQNGAN